MGIDQTAGYTPPTLTYYGTVQELTLGNGNVSPQDSLLCIAPYGGHPSSNSPSGVTCKLSN